MASEVPSGAAQVVDPYVAVRAQLIARQWDGRSGSRAKWFQALIKAGLTGFLAKKEGGDGGLAAMLTAAEVLGGHAVPLSYVPAAGAVAALGVCAGPVASRLLESAVSGQAPVLLALGDGNLLSAVAGDNGAIIVTGQCAAVPDGQEASTLLAQANMSDGPVLFAFSANEVRVAGPSAAASDGLHSYQFNACKIPAENILVQGQAAIDVRDYATCVLQLGLGAELAGLGAALLKYAGAGTANERDLAGALMDVLLARALVFGSAGLVQQGASCKMAIASGARALASRAAIGAAKLALGAGGETKQNHAIAQLAKRAILASRIYGSPQQHMGRFGDWCRQEKPGIEAFQNLSGAAAKIAGGQGAGKMSDLAGALISVHQDSVLSAANKGQTVDPLLLNTAAHATLSLMALVCADGQRQAGGDISAAFMIAAGQLVEQRIADCALLGAGYGFAGEDEDQLFRQFFDAYRCKTGS